MKTFLTALFVSLPAAAQAMCMHGAGGGCAPQHGGLVAGAVYAVVATLGYWVLLQAVKESSTCIKRIGDVLGSVLVVVGLLGLLCAVAGHVKSSMRRCCGGPGPMMAAPGQPQGMGMMPPVADEPAPAPKKAAKPK
jgi:hypothetical protein